MSYIPQTRTKSAKIKHFLEYAMVRICYFTINILPFFFINLLTSFISCLVWWFFPFRLNVAYDNLSTVFPAKSHVEKLKIAKSAYKNFIHAACLIFVINRKNASKLIDTAQIGGIKILDEALSEGKGVILTTYHGCWFEAYFAWFSKGTRLTSLVYKRQKNPLCDSFFVNLRRHYGNSLKHIDKYEKLSSYIQELDSGRILIISLDQNYTDNGTPVTLFDREFSCAKGTALLHLKTGAPVLTSVYYVKEGVLHIDFDRVDLRSYRNVNDDNIREICYLSTKMYEKTISAYPDQWFSLFHRLWKKKGYPKKIQRGLKEVFMSDN